jgi:hypothetical protein
MKNILMLAGVAVAGIGAYMLLKKKSGCGCDKTTSKATIVKSDSKNVIYPDRALEHFDTKFTSLFPTPVEKFSQHGPLLLDNADANSAQNFVSQ